MSSSHEFYVAAEADGARYLCFGDKTATAAAVDLSELDHVCRMDTRQRVPLNSDSTAGAAFAEYSSNGYISGAAFGSYFTAVVSSTLPPEGRRYPVTMIRPDTRVAWQATDSRLERVPLRRVTRQGDARIIHTSAGSDFSYPDPICDFIIENTDAGSLTGVTISYESLWEANADTVDLLRSGGLPSTLVYMHNKADHTECAMTLSGIVLPDDVRYHFGLPRSVQVSTLRMDRTLVAADSGWSGQGLNKQVHGALCAHLIAPLALVVLQFVGNHTIGMEFPEPYFRPVHAEYRAKFVKQARDYRSASGGDYAPTTFQAWCRWMLCCEKFADIYDLGRWPCPFESNYVHPTPLSLAVSTPIRSYAGGRFRQRSYDTTIDRLFLVFLWQRGLLSDHLFPPGFDVSPRDVDQFTYSRRGVELSVR